MKSLRDVKIGVLGGGISEEREISLISAKEVYQALVRSELQPVFIDINTSEEQKIKSFIMSYGISMAFIALHGELGEDGKIQHILEELNIPYTGSGPHASFLAMDKISSKEKFIERDILTPKFFTLSNSKNIPCNIKYPVVVKPNFLGSSFGISMVKEESNLMKAIDIAFSYKGKVIVEDYIKGRELTVGILEDKPLAIVEIISKEAYFDLKAKYAAGRTEFVVPAKLEKSIYKKVESEAIRAHKALGCRHFSRVDIRLSKENAAYVLEVNSIPGLTSKSLLPLSAKACGIDFNKLILKMIELTLCDKLLR